MNLTKTDVLGISLFLVLGSCVFQAKAGVFVETGTSEYDQPFDTLWYQEAYPHHFDHSDQFFRIGYEWSGFRASYFNLGEFSRVALATQDEHKYMNGRCAYNECHRPDVYYTSGDTQGLLFSYVGRYRWLYGEVGVSYAQQTFSIQAASVYAESQYNHYANGRYYFDDKEKGIGYMYSAGVQYKDFTLSYGVWKNHSDFDNGNFPSGADLTKTLALGYRF